MVHLTDRPIREGGVKVLSKFWVCNERTNRRLKLPLLELLPVDLAEETVFLDDGNIVFLDTKSLARLFAQKSVQKILCVRRKKVRQLKLCFHNLLLQLRNVVCFEWRAAGHHITSQSTE